MFLTTAWVQMSTYTATQSSFKGTSMTGSYSSLVNDLLDNNLRENALAELSKQREQLPDLAVVLWNRFGIFKFYVVFNEFRCRYNFDS